MYPYPSPTLMRVLFALIYRIIGKKNNELNNKKAYLKFVVCVVRKETLRTVRN